MNIPQLVVDHQEAIVSGVSAVAGVVLRHFWPQAQKVESKFAGLTVNSQNPTVQALALKADELIEQAIPGAGDARYSAYAALIVHEDPILEPLQPEIANLLQALCVSVKTAAAEVASQKSVAVPTPATPANPGA